MRINDLILMGISLIFCITIIPSIIKMFKTRQVNFSWLSIIPLWIGLWGMGSIMLIDGYYLAGAFNIINSFEWFFIGMLKIEWRNTIK